MKYPRKYAKSSMCLICKHEADFGKRIRGVIVCRKCLETHCEDCLVEMVEEKLPSRKNQSLHVCVKCYKEQLAKDKAKEEEYLEMAIDRLKRNLIFQTDHQYCLTCGEFNTSRNEKGEVLYRFCENCRQVKGDVSFMKMTQPRDRDNRNIVFDKVVGVR